MKTQRTPGFWVIMIVNAAWVVVMLLGQVMSCSVFLAAVALYGLWGLWYLHSRRGVLVNENSWNQTR